MPSSGRRLARGLRASLAFSASLGFTACLHSRLGAAGADACPTPGGALAFDLHVAARDPNGLPFAPIWLAQQRGPQFSGAYCRPDPDELCGGFPTDAPVGFPQGRPKCNSIAKADVPVGFHAFMCSLESVNDGRNNKLRAHVNWVPATYEGFLGWGDTSGRPPFGDGDFTLSLAPVERTASPLKFAARRACLTPYPDGGPVALHIEFKAAEVSDHFDHTWWKNFRDKAKGKQNAAMEELPTSRFAVATGLLGLDAEHKGHAELHPVYALALQTGCTTEESPGRFSNRWAILARNWGNEGYCSSYNCHHQLLLDAAGTFALRLPLGDVMDVSEPELATGPGDTELWANNAALQVAQKVDVDASGPFAVVRLRLPPPEETALVYGEIRLRFKGTGAPGCPVDPRPASAGPGPLLLPAGVPSRRGGAEALLIELREEAPPEERTRLEGALGRRETLAAAAPAFQPVRPSGEIVPVGAPIAEDRVFCPPLAAPALEADPERAAVCDIVKRLPKARVARDKRLTALFNECSK